MQIELSDDIRAYIARQVAEGKYATEGEVVEAAIHQLRQEDWFTEMSSDEYAELLAKLDAGILSLEQGASISADVVFQELRELNRTKIEKNLQK